MVRIIWCMLIAMALWNGAYLSAFLLIALPIGFYVAAYWTVFNIAFNHRRR